MMLSPTGICSYCGSRVTNIPGKRHSREKLERIHDESCPGRARVMAERPKRAPRNKTEMIAALRGEEYA